MSDQAFSIITWPSLHWIPKSGPMFDSPRCFPYIPMLSISEFESSSFPLFSYHSTFQYSLGPLIIGPFYYSFFFFFFCLLWHTKCLRTVSLTLECYTGVQIHSGIFWFWRGKDGFGTQKIYNLDRVWCDQ